MREILFPQRRTLRYRTKYKKNLKKKKVTTENEKK